MSQLKEAFENASLQSYVWKGAKKKEGDKIIQESVKLMDMDSDELNKCYNHCKKMLYNDDPKHLGRYNILEEVNSQINKCNVELLLRYFENTYQQDERRSPTKRFSLMIDLRELMRNNPHVEDWSQVPITTVTSDLPSEFKDVKISDILQGCTDSLEAFDKSHLTMSFITKMGLWFTKSEENELKNDKNSNVERLKIAKERLRLPAKLNLSLSEKGLSYHEMRAILTLPKKQRYSDMTTEQLVTLSRKVLLRYLVEVDKHIYNWKKLLKQIEAVAKKKNIDLIESNDKN